ncbi:hypothetical protein [Saccharothrix deserti]|uniref:hypothetical protein n=1 Tax=Saccharothrix deserti TaxID=2593674 RepID=UPI001EE3F637|nr:hypothetical protein [Saccharothrix deserti]
MATVALQASLPAHLVGPARWPLVGLALVLFAVLVIADPGRISRESALLRVVGLGLIAVISAANAWSVALLVDWLIGGHAPDATELLRSGAAVWLTNVLVFALWYWELDRGGPAARAAGRRDLPDFEFAQMTETSLAPADWEPHLVDYLYLSFTNATAFSPTDVLPLSRWAKLIMMLQSAVSLVTVALVIARAVNVLD